MQALVGRRLSVYLDVAELVRRIDENLKELSENNGASVYLRM